MAKGQKNEWPVYVSMRKCEAATGIPEAILRQAKEMGCGAFKGHRIHLETLLKFLGPKMRLDDGKGAESVPTQVGARKQLDLWRSEREKLKFLRDSNKMILLDEVKQGADAAMSELFGSLDRVFCSELPPDLVGNTEIQMRDKFRKELDAVMVQAKAKLTALAEAEKEDDEEES